MSSGDESEVVDLERLQASAGGDRGLMLELIELYLADSDAKVPSLLAAARERELYLVGRVAHGLKGASAALGCTEAAAAFRRVEEVGRAGDEGAVDGAVAQAREAWRRACERLKGLAA